MQTCYALYSHCSLSVSVAGYYQHRTNETILEEGKIKPLWDD